MLSKEFFLTVVALLMLITVKARSFAEYCSDCEEEIWEEIPCNQPPNELIANRLTTPSPSVTPTTTVSTPTTNITTYEHATEKPVTISVEKADPSKTCYCDCKIGCKEYCRKVMGNNDLKKEITQVSVITQNIAEGKIETKHSHQQQFIPNEYKRDTELYSYPNDVKNKPLFSTSSLPGNTYSIHDLAKLLNADDSDKNNLPNFYSQHEVKEYQIPIPVKSKVDNIHIDIPSGTEAAVDSETSCTTKATTTDKTITSKYLSTSETNKQNYNSFEHAINAYLKDYVNISPDGTHPVYTLPSYSIAI